MNGKKALTPDEKDRILEGIIRTTYIMLEQYNLNYEVILKEKI